MKILRRSLFALALIACVSLLIWSWWLERAQRRELYTLIEDRLYLGGSVAEPPPDTRAVLNLCMYEDSYRAASHRWEAIADGGPVPIPGRAHLILQITGAQALAPAGMSMGSMIQLGIAACVGDSDVFPLAPGLQWLREMVQFIDSQRGANTTMYVHCAAGANRGPMMVAAYLMYEHGWTRDAALAFIRSKRPQITPNPAYMKLLAEWEQELKKPILGEGK